MPFECTQVLYIKTLLNVLLLHLNKLNEIQKKQSDSHSNTWVQSCCSDPGDFPNIPSCLSPWRRLHYIRSSHLTPSSPSWVLSWSNKKATIITASQERRSNPQQTNSSRLEYPENISGHFVLTADTLTLLRKQHDGRLERESFVSLLPYLTGEL